MDDFQCSEKTTNLFRALGEIQGLGLNPPKNATNPHFNSTFANLESVLETSLKPLYQNTLTITQMPLGGVDSCRLLNQLTHESGEWIRWTTTTPLAKKDPQGVGAAITYLRRYSLNSVLNMVDVDDDGNHASNLQSKPQNTQSGASKPQHQDEQVFVPQAVRRAPLQPGNVVSEKQLKRLFAIMKSAGYETYEVDEYISAAFGLHSKTELNRQQYDEVCSLLESKRLPRETKMNNGGPYAPVPQDEIPF